MGNRLAIALLIAPGIAASPAVAGYFANTIQVCPATAPDDASAFKVVSDTDARTVAYSCANTTKSCASFSSCAVSGGNNMKYVAFVVDGMAGWIRYNQFAAGTKDTLVVHNGGSGTEWFGGDDWYAPILGRLRTAQIRVAEIRWELGYMAAPGVAMTGYGWFTRKDTNASTIHRQAERPAKAIQWIKENLAQEGAKYASLGCSAGSTVTAFSHLFYGQVFDYQLFASGPWLWNTRAGCGGENWGQSAFAQWEGTILTGGYALRTTVDYLNKDPLFPTGGRCFAGTAATDPGGALGSWAQDYSGANMYSNAPDADWSVDALHQVDFVVNHDGGVIVDDDYETGYAAQARGFYNRLLAGSGGGVKNSNLGWYNNEGGNHCDVNRTEIWCDLLKAQGLGASALLDCSGLDQ